MGLTKKLALVLAALILLPSVWAADVPNAVNICDPSVNCVSNISFWFYGEPQIQTLSFANFGGYFTSAIQTSKYVFFTNLALNAPSLFPNGFSPIQSFGLGTENANITISVVSTNTVGVTRNFVVAGPTTPKLFYYYLSDSPISYPYNVTVISGGVTHTVLYTDYMTTLTTFSNCNSGQYPCVFLNAGNNTVIVNMSKDISGTDTVYFCSVGTCAHPTSQSIFPFLAALLLLVFVGISVAVLYQRRPERRR